MTTEITVYPEPERSLSPYQQRMAKASDIVNDDFFGQGGISFKSVLDIVNPLQHIPVVSTLYREFTGDNNISSGSRLVGGALFGGGIGFLAAIANEIASETTGKDIGSNLFAAVTNKYQEASKA